MSCGCGGTTSGCACDERAPQTPLPVTNRPGLPAIRRRVLTHATAKATMLRALSDPALVATADFASRSDSDFGVALIDIAATTADLITFYTERFVNEHYLGTATERRSVVELSRLLGYQLRPGMAPVVDLAFTLDATPGAPTSSLIVAGTGVQSSPDPGQQPVVYETLADVTASPAWNAIRPRHRVPHPASPGTALALAGVVQITTGDGVLYRTGAIATSVAFGVVDTVTAVDAVPDQPGKPGSPARTEITVTAVGSVAATVPAELLPAGPGTGTVPASVSWLAGTAISAADLDTRLLARSATLADVAGPFARTFPTPTEVLLFRQQRALFGSQAPLSSSVAAAVVLATGPAVGVPVAVTNWAKTLALPWESTTVASFPGATAGDVLLDGGTPSVPVGSLLVLRDGDTWGGYRVSASSGVGLAALGISGRAVRVHLGSVVGLSSFSIRRTTAFTAPTQAALADVPAPVTAGPVTYELEGLFLGLREGRPVVLTGEPAADRGHPTAVSTTLATVLHDFGAALTTTVTLADPPTSALARGTVAICANVAPASQGETRREVLGSGDSRLAFQSFRLRQPPLTYLSSSSAAGLASTLSVWVDEVRWSPVYSFIGAGPDDHVFVTRDQDGQTVVQFGDGVTGARLPTGTANVRAVYRAGGNLAGRVRAGQLTLPMSRAGGVTGVGNPAASDGGDDPETAEAARISAPLWVTTIDRVVSMSDYALFARSFPGVAKAQAVWARAAARRGVLLTVAGNHGDVLDPSKGVGKNLLGAIVGAGDPLVPEALLRYVPKSFRLAANVRTAGDRVRADVLAAVWARLQRAFDFDVRGLGQPVAASEVLAEIHSVPGVVAAALTSFWTFDAGTQLVAPVGPPPDVLTANAPAPGADIGTLTGADLIVIDAAPISWGVLP